MSATTAGGPTGHIMKYIDQNRLSGLYGAAAAQKEKEKLAAMVTYARDNANPSAEFQSLMAAGQIPAGFMAQYGPGGTDAAAKAQASSSTSSTTGTTDWLEEYKTAYEEAKAANLERYEQLLEGVETLGEQERKDIAERYAGVLSGSMQDLTSAGLSGTTIKPTVRAGVAREETSAAARLEEQLRREKLGIIERREDIYPNIPLMAQLAQGYGQYAAGQTGGVGTTGTKLYKTVSDYYTPTSSAYSSIGTLTGGLFGTTSGTGQGIGKMYPTYIIK